jgi:ferredoxin
MPRIPFVDSDLCTGCELCVETVPDVFQMEGDVATVTDPEGASEEEIQEAVDNCPVEAITWQDE